MDSILKKITPSLKEREKFNQITDQFLTSINKKLSGAKAILGGSGAKGTWLAGSHDVDVFVLYNYKKYAPHTDNLSDLLKKSLHKAFPKHRISTLHGSRDYFQLHYEQIVFEVIPILDIQSIKQALNITDISPLHAKWVSKLSQKTKNEIMLAKQFFKANNLYGAESYIGGFSGYILEILIAYYGSLTKLLSHAKDWKAGNVIDLKNHYKGKDVFFEMNKSKLQSPIIVIDPVDKTRNALAALSQEKFLLLKKHANAYLKHPKEKYFEIHQPTIEELKKKYTIVLEITPNRGKKDVVGAKLVKTLHHIKTRLKDFQPTKINWHWDDKAYFYLKTKTTQLPVIETRKGPPIKLTEHVKHFKKEHKNTFTKNNTIYAKIKRPHPQLQDFLQHLLKDRYIKERTTKVRLL